MESQTFIANTTLLNITMTIKNNWIEIGTDSKVKKPLKNPIYNSMDLVLNSPIVRQMQESKDECCFRVSACADIGLGCYDSPGFVSQISSFPKLMR